MTTLDPTAARTLARLAKQVEQAVAEAELSLPQYRMLAFLAEVDFAAATALAGRLGVSKPSITALVDGLVARGLVTRRSDRIDRRRVEHLLTAKGQRALAGADRVINRHLERLLEDVDDRDARRVDTGLAVLADALDRARQAALSETTSQGHTRAGR